MAAKKTSKSTVKKKTPAARKTATRPRKLVVAEDNGDTGEPSATTPPVIVATPAKGKASGKSLGRGYRVRATIGHLRDLPEKKLGIEIENDFKPEYVTIPGKEKTLAELKAAAKTSREIFLATDPDREGEAIAWHVASQISGKNSAPIRRVL